MLFFLSFFSEFEKNKCLAMHFFSSAFRCLLLFIRWLIFCEIDRKPIDKWIIIQKRFEADLSSIEVIVCRSRHSHNNWRKCLITQQFRAMLFYDWNQFHWIILSHRFSWVAIILIYFFIRSILVIRFNPKIYCIRFDGN